MITVFPTLIADGEPAPPPVFTDIIASGVILVLGDRNHPDWGIVVEADRTRAIDTSGCGNDPWQMAATTGTVPWNGYPLTVGTLDGDDALEGDGQATNPKNVTGFLCGTPDGDNLLRESETITTTAWTIYGTVPSLTLSAGPTPPAPYTDSTTLADNPGGDDYHLIIQTPAALYQVGFYYEASVCVMAGTGGAFLFFQIDNLTGIFLNPATGTLGTKWGPDDPIGGTPAGFHVVDRGGGWWEVWFRFRANSAAALNQVRVWVTGGDGSYNSPSAGRSLHVTGVQISPVRTLTERRPYGRSDATHLIQPTHTACTVIVVFDDDVSDGEAAYFDSSSSVAATNLGPMIFRDNVDWLARGFRQSGAADVSFAPGAGTISDPACIIATCDPATDQTAIYVNGLMVKQFSCSTYAKPASFFRIGALFTSIYGSDARQGFTAYVVNSPTFVELHAAYTYAHSLHPSIQPPSELTPLWLPGRSLRFSGASLVAGLADGDPVGTWQDDTEFNHDATEAGAVRPTFIESDPHFNGHPSVALDGSDDRLLIAGVVNDITQNSGGYYVFGVVYVTSIGTNDATVYANDCIWGDGGQNQGTFLRSASGGEIVAYAWSGGVKQVALPCPVGQAFVFCQRHYAGQMYLSVNGGAEVQVAYATDSSGVAQVGLGYNAGAARAHVKFAEITFGKRGISAANRAATFAHLMGKYLP